MSMLFNSLSGLGARRLAIGMLIVAAAVGCGDKTAEPPAGTGGGSLSEAPGGTLIVAVPGNPGPLYPPTTDRALDIAIIGGLFDRLAEIDTLLNTDGDKGFEHRLADSWTWASDSLSIAFMLNPKARFHDGHSVSARDVQFTFRAYTDPKGRSVNGGYLSNIDSVSVRDSLTAVFWFKRRTLHQFFDATYHMFILPSHLLANIPIQELGEDSVSARAIGTGRFRLASRVPKQRVEVISDTGNYRGRAKLDRVVWAQNLNVQAAALSVFDGNADFFEKLQPDDLDKVPQNPNLKIVPYVQAGYSYLGFNFRSAKDSTKPNPFFNDLRVRRALAMAVDRVRSTQSVLDTFARPAVGPAPRSMFRFADSLKQIPYDVTHARALLDSAGWILEPGKDVRTKDGVPFSFDILVVNTSRPRVAYTDLIIQQFRGVGVSATKRELDGPVWGGLVDSAKFDAYLGAWNVTPGMRGLPGVWGSRGVQNYGSFKDKQFDSDIDGALSSLVPAKSNSLFIHAFQEIIDQAPAIFLYEDRLIGLMHKRVQPRNMRADAWYSDLADWTIDPKNQLPRDRVGLR